MGKSKKLIKKISVLIITMIVIVLLLNLGLSYFIKNKIEKTNSNYHITLKEVKVNILTQSITVNNIAIDSKKREKDSISFKTTKLYINGISISDIRNPKKIDLSNFNIISPYFKTYKGDSTYENKNYLKDLQSLKIKNIKITNGKMVSFDTKGDSTYYIKNMNLTYKDFKIDTNSIKKTLPYTYSEQLVDIENIKFRMNKFQELIVKNVDIKNTKAVFKDLKITPLYNKQEYQTKLSKEKDWIKFHVKNLIVNDIDLDNKEIDFSSKKVEIDSASLYVYRNKLLPDQTKYKPLYSKMLRELPLKINIDSVKIKNSSIVYDERINPDGKPGRLEFAHFNSIIKNINNRKNSGLTELNIKTRFMNNGDLHVNWSFEVSNTADYFNIQGRLINFDAPEADKFIAPNLNSKAKGIINNLDFNIKGNDVRADGNIEMKYEGLKVEIINKEKSKVNKLLSTVANIFVKKSEKVPETKQIDVKRDQQKSFFNYFWICIEDGLKAIIL